MPVLLNLLGFFAYAALAAAAALHAPSLSLAGLPPLGQLEAYTLAWMILLSGALVHGFIVKVLSSRGVRGPGLELLEDLAGQKQEIVLLRQELGGMRQALEAAATSGNLRGGGRTIEEVMSEVKVLKSLMNQLSGSREAEALRPSSIAPSLSRPVIGVETRDEEYKQEEIKTAQSQLSAEDLMLGSIAHQGKAQLIRKPARPVLVPHEEKKPIRSLPPVAEGLSEEEVLTAVREALRQDQVDLVLQPIVSLPQRKRRFYECFSRLRTPKGELILPEQYIPIAERAKHITAIDNMLLFRCVQLVRRIHRKSQNVDFFCNISPHTIADVDFFSDFLDFLENNRELAAHMIFEFAQADFQRWSEAGAGLLRRLSDLGCRISLDHVVETELDPDTLARQQVSFVKIEVNLLLSVLKRQPDLLSGLRGREIDLIVEKVENETLLSNLLDYQIDFGQGYLFGEPRLARPAS